MQKKAKAQKEKQAKNNVYLSCHPFSIRCVYILLPPGNPESLLHHPSSHHITQSIAKLLASEIGGEKIGVPAALDPQGESGKSLGPRVFAVSKSLLLALVRGLASHVEWDVLVLDHVSERDGKERERKHERSEARLSAN